jgi:hypothetical protein
LEGRETPGNVLLETIIALKIREILYRSSEMGAFSLGLEWSGRFHSLWIA